MFSRKTKESAIKPDQKTLTDKEFEAELREFFAREIRDADKRYPVTAGDMERVRAMLRAQQTPSTKSREDNK